MELGAGFPGSSQGRSEILLLYLPISRGIDPNPAGEAPGINQLRLRVHGTQWPLKQNQIPCGLCEALGRRDLVEAMGLGQGLHSSMHAFVHPCMHSSMYAFVHPCMHSFMFTEHTCVPPASSGS